MNLCDRDASAAQSSIGHSCWLVVADSLKKAYRLSSRPSTFQIASGFSTNPDIVSLTKHPQAAATASNSSTDSTADTRG